VPSLAPPPATTTPADPTDSPDQTHPAAAVGPRTWLPARRPSRGGIKERAVLGRTVHIIDSRRQTLRGRGLDQLDHLLLHYRAPLLECVGHRPQVAVVEVGRVLEAQGGVAVVELARVLEEDDDLAVRVGVGGRTRSWATAAGRRRSLSRGRAPRVHDRLAPSRRSCRGPPAGRQLSWPPASPRRAAPRRAASSRHAPRR